MDADADGHGSFISTPPPKVIVVSDGHQISKPQFFQAEFLDGLGISGLDVVIDILDKLPAYARAHDPSRNFHHHRNDKLIPLDFKSHIFQDFWGEFVDPDIFETLDLEPHTSGFDLDFVV